MRLTTSKYYLLVWLIVILVSMFDPGRNASNIGEFSSQKTFLFVASMFVLIAVLAIPLFTKVMRGKVSVVAYWFHVLVFFPVACLYIFNAIHLLS